jgi:hypothetical protein
LTSRVLPVEEWPKLAAMWPMVHEVNPEALTVIVVEDGEEIVGCWGLITLAHAEGLWIAPEHRGKGPVARRLWSAFNQVAHERDISSVITGAEDGNAEVVELLDKRGAQKLPPAYLLSLEG